MKVIKPGRDQVGWSIEQTCTGAGNGNGGCGAKLLVEQPDLMKHTKTDHGGGTTHYVLFRCCSCGVLTDIPEKNWPPQSIINDVKPLFPKNEEY